VSPAGGSGRLSAIDGGASAGLGAAEGGSGRDVGAIGNVGFGASLAFGLAGAAGAVPIAELAAEVGGVSVGAGRASCVWVEEPAGKGRAGELPQAAQHQPTQNTQPFTQRAPDSPCPEPGSATDESNSVAAGTPASDAATAHDELDEQWALCRGLRRNARYPSAIQPCGDQNCTRPRQGPMPSAGALIRSDRTPSGLGYSLPGSPGRR
jgi:hypothetical protein